MRRRVKCIQRRITFVIFCGGKGNSDTKFLEWKRIGRESNTDTWPFCLEICNPKFDPQSVYIGKIALNLLGRNKMLKKMTIYYIMIL